MKNKTYTKRRWMNGGTLEMEYEKKPEQIQVNGMGNHKIRIIHWDERYMVRIATAPCTTIYQQCGNCLAGNQYHSVAVMCSRKTVASCKLHSLTAQNAVKYTVHSCWSSNHYDGADLSAHRFVCNL